MGMGENLNLFPAQTCSGTREASEITESLHCWSPESAQDCWVMKSQCACGNIIIVATEHKGYVGEQNKAGDISYFRKSDVTSLDSLYMS